MKDQTETKTKSWKKYLKITAGIILGWSFWFCMLILALRWVNPSVTAFTLQEDWDALDKDRYSLRENWVPAEELPDHLKLAVVASEDQRFYEHWGLDLGAIEDALEEKEQRGRVRGASTITQQVAKNLFLTSAQNYFRKGIEAGIAALIDLFWSKSGSLKCISIPQNLVPGCMESMQHQSSIMENQHHNSAQGNQRGWPRFCPTPRS